MASREPSMEDILASIKKVIAEEKELRTSPEPIDAVEDEPLPEESDEDGEVDILELNEPLAPPIDLGPPLLDEDATSQSRQALDQLTTIAASVPAAPQVNPLEEMVREMLKPMLKEWLDNHLPEMVEELVTREIARITGKHF